MKIVDLTTFRSMPPGTVFSKYEPCVFGDLCIKGETWSNDFLYQGIADAIDCESSSHMVDLLDDALKNGTNLKLDLNCQGRDGLYEDDQLYAVWERQDVELLIARLQAALTGKDPE